jgi:hypothetical protein
MKIIIPARFRPILVTVAVIALAYGSMFVVDLLDLYEPEITDCCAPEA